MEYTTREVRVENNSSASNTNDNKDGKDNRRAPEPKTKTVHVLREVTLKLSSH